jgi:drug/metabolite transporter (DMT)-like permease
MSFGSSIPRCLDGCLYLFGCLGSAPDALAKNVAITFVGLIFVTALAPLVLSEQVGWRRWTAVLVGFVCVLVMLRPGGDGLNWAVLFPAGAGPVRCFAVRISCTLRHSALPKRSR